MRKVAFSFVVAVALLWMPLTAAAEPETLLNPGILIDHSYRSQGNGYGAEVSVMHFPKGVMSSLFGYGAFVQTQGTSRGGGRVAGEGRSERP